MDECFLNTQEFADLHGVTRRTVQRWVSQGLVFGVRIGRSILIPCDEIPPTELDRPEPEQEPIDDNYPTIETDPYEGMEPEEIENLEVDDYPVFAPSDFDSHNLRRIFATGAEAEVYASEIPVPTTVFKRSVDLLYQVVVEYP